MVVGSPYLRMPRPMRLTTADLITDRRYRQWFREIPLLTHTPGPKPWYYYVQRHGSYAWARAAMSSYTEALRRAEIDLRSRSFYDVVIVSRAKAFPPPSDIRRRTKKNPAGVWDFRWLWPEADPEYRWCMYCRRPTRFLKFKSHHALKVVTVDRARCETCGVGE